MAQLDARALLAYEQAKGRLQRQVDRLGEMRSTTNFLLAATALVASFLGREALNKDGINHTIEAVAVVALVIGVLCGIRPLWPIRDQEPRPRVAQIARWFGLEEWAGLDLMWRGNVKVETVQELPSDASEAHRALAAELERRAVANAELLDKRLRWLMACALLLALQVILWSLSL